MAGYAALIAGYLTGLTNAKPLEGVALHTSASCVHELALKNLIEMGDVD
jgi:hypothetical protein